MNLHRIQSMWPYVLAAAVLSSASACTTASSDSRYFGSTTPPEGQVLRYYSGSEPESLDPLVGTGQPEARIYMALFEGLTEYDPKTGQPIPAIAERWEANADNTQFIFHLRRDARWSNGRRVTASDFVYSLRRGLTPEFAARNAYMAYYVLNAQPFNEGASFVRDKSTGQFVADPENPSRRLLVPGDPNAREKALTTPRFAAARGKEFVPVRAEDVGIDAVDDFTLRFRLEQPIPFLVGLVAHQFFRPVPREAIEKDGEAWTKPGHIVTNGPFTLREWKPYNEIVVVRSPTYWNRSIVRLDEIHFFALEDATTVMNLYKAGELDAVGNHTVPAAWIDSIRPLKDYMDAPEIANSYFQINTKRPPMDDVRVRKAFNMSVDRVALSAYRRVTKPLSSFVPQDIFPGYPMPKGDEFDPVRARALLVEAGYKDLSGQYDAAKFPISEVELSYNTSESNREVAEFMQAQWKQNLGLTVPLKNMEWKTFLDMRANLEYKGMSRAGWIGDYQDPFTFLNLFYTPAGDNGTGWWDPLYVKMLDQANRIHDQTQRYRLLAQAEAYLLAAQPVIPVLSGATNWVKKPYVKGMYPNPGTMHAWQFVYIEHDPSKWEDPPVRSTN